MARRHLVLRREHLSELSVEDLSHVAGAQPPPIQTPQCPDNTYYCITGTARCGVTRLTCV